MTKGDNDDKEVDNDDYKVTIMTSKVTQMTSDMDDKQSDTVTRKITLPPLTKKGVLTFLHFLKVIHYCIRVVFVFSRDI